jgi:hypothetical protein
LTRSVEVENALGTLAGSTIVFAPVHGDGWHWQALPSHHLGMLNDEWGRRHVGIGGGCGRTAAFTSLRRKERSLAAIYAGTEE